MVPRKPSMDSLPPEIVSAHSFQAYTQTLIAAATECVDACATLQRVTPVLPLSSGFARDVHTLFYVVSNVETALHHFIERELLQVRTGDPRSREHGGRLQDALERATLSTTVKPTVKASLLAGGIASLLHLITVTLRRLNSQLEGVLEAERRGGAYVEMVAAIVSACIWARSIRSRWKAVGSTMSAICIACSVRVVQLRAQRKRAILELNSSQERLSLLLQLWVLSTSVLQRAHKVSYPIAMAKLTCCLYDTTHLVTFRCAACYRQIRTAISICIRWIAASQHHGQTPLVRVRLHYQSVQIALSAGEGVQVPAKTLAWSRQAALRLLQPAARAGLEV